MRSEATQSSLVDRARSGDRQAYAELVAGHRRRLLGVAFAKATCREDALDAVQDAVLAGLRLISSLRSSDAFGAWMDTLVASACAAQRDKAHRRHETPLSAVPDAAAATSPSADGLWLRDLVRELPHRQREVIRSFHFDGMSVREIARALGRPEGTVKRWLSEARQAMRERMERMEPTLAVVGEDLTEAERQRLDTLAVHHGLETRHFRTFEAGNQAVADEPPAAIVLAKCLERPCDAFVLLSRLRTSAPGQREFPIIMLGPESDWYCFAAWAGGVDSYFTRPFDPSEVGETLARALAAARPA